MKEIIEKLVDAVEILFAKQINAACEESKESLNKQSLIFHDDALIKKLLRDLLKFHVGRLCQKTFIYEFHRYRRSLGIPADPMSSAAFESYVAKINEEMISEWFERYKVLGEMITGAVTNSCNYVSYVCANFSEDAELLCERKLIKKGSGLQAVYPLDSDPHNGSKVALCFDFGVSGKLIYKHRSLELDTVIDRIFREILCFEGLEDSPVAPTVNKGTYGWQGFIKQESPEEAELDAAYYNLGMCASVFAAIGATDLHDENIIFRKAMPYFIDLETGLKPSRRRVSSTLNEKLEDVLYESVVSTSILPAKLPTIPHSILIGAINTPYPQKTSEKIFTIKNYGTDAIDIAKEIIDVNRPSCPIIMNDNKSPDPVLYQSDFVRGYTFGYMKIIEMRDAICEILSDINCPIRVIARPTVQYGLVLDACLFPENLVDDASISKILAYLKPSKLVEDKRIAEEILNEEKKSIKNGDIPYFYVNSGEMCMRSGDYASKSAFMISPVDNAIRTIKRCSDKRLIQERRLIAEGYAEIRLHEAKYLNVDELGNKSSLFSEMLERVNQCNPYPIIDMIKELAVATEDDTPMCGWLGGVYGDFGASYDSVNFISLHDTGGIVLLFEALSEYGEEKVRDEYKDIFCIAKRGLATMREKLKAVRGETQLSVISGEASFDYIFNHKKKCLKETEDMVETLVIEETEPGDVYKGITGIGLLLSTYPETGDNAMEIIEEVLENDATPEYTKEGIAHGELGAIWTKFRLAKRLGDIKRCEELFEQVQGFSPGANGWCNGNAGLLMIAVEMSAMLNVKRELYYIAEKAMLLPDNEAIDISVCHGAAGVLQSLLFAYAVLEDDEYLAMANDYWEKVITLAREKGFYTGEKNRDYLLGYFLGWSGVAHSMLLLDVCNKGDKPWFLLNLSSDIYQKELMGKEMDVYAVCGRD